MLEPVFKCVVDHPQDGVLYDVQWFIGNDLIPKAGSYNVTYQTMNASSLKTDHWADNYSLNFNVSIVHFNLGFQWKKTKYNVVCIF